MNEKKKIYKLSEVPEGEKIYLAKGFFGWRIVKPIRNEDNSINWLNLLVGGWANLILLIFIAILIVTFFLANHEATSQLTNCLALTKDVIKVPEYILNLTLPY